MISGDPGMPMCSTYRCCARLECSTLSGALTTNSGHKTAEMQRCQSVNVAVNDIEGVLQLPAGEPREVGGRGGGSRDPTAARSGNTGRRGQGGGGRRWDGSGGG